MDRRRLIAIGKAVAIRPPAMSFVSFPIRRRIGMTGHGRRPTGIAESGLLDKIGSVATDMMMITILRSVS